MSKYAIQLGDALIAALKSVPSAHASQLSAYWANREFFASEFHHFVSVLDDYENRIGIMKAAHEKYCQIHGTTKKYEWALQNQGISETTSNAERKRMIGDVRSWLVELAERSLNERISNNEEYDSFMRKLKTD